MAIRTPSKQHSGFKVIKTVQVCEGLMLELHQRSTRWGLCLLWLLGNSETAQFISRNVPTTFTVDHSGGVGLLLVRRSSLRACVATVTVANSTSSGATFHYLLHTRRVWDKAKVIHALGLWKYPLQTSLTSHAVLVSPLLRSLASVS